MGSRDTRSASHGGRLGSEKGFSRLAELSDLVLNWGFLIGVGAVVVAGEDIGVDSAHADVVVGLLVAGVDAALEAGDASIDDVLSLAFILRSNQTGSGREGEGDGGRETHFD